MIAGRALAYSRGTPRRDPALAAALLALLALALLVAAPRRLLPASPPHLRLAVADLRGHALVVGNPRDPASARRIPLAGGPHELVALADGRLAVSLEQAGALAIVDAASGAVETLHIGGTPHGLALMAGTLYVTDRSTNTLRRFTVGSWQELPPLAAGAWPHAVQPLPGGALAVANAAGDTLAIGAHVVTTSHVPETIAVAPDGTVATAGSLGGAIELFDAGGGLIAHYAVGGRPVRVLFAPDGRTLAAALSADGSIAIVDVHDDVHGDGDGVRRVAVGGVPDGLAFSPDGRWLYAGDEVGGAVSVVDVQRGVVVARFAVGVSAGALLVLGSP